MSIVPVFMRLHTIKNYVKKHAPGMEPSTYLVGTKKLEFKALNLLLRVLVLYLLVVNIGAMVFLTIYSLANPTVGKVMKENNVSPYWFGCFMPIAAFNNAGFSLFDDSVMSFIDEPFIIFILALLIIMGNTGYPCFLFFILWLMNRFGHDQERKATLRYLYKQPRACFTHLFPQLETQFLVMILSAFALSETAAFLVLDWHTDDTHLLTPIEKIEAGLFQSISTRTAGFNIVEVALCHPAMQVFYMTMMYVSAYPVALSVRKSSTVKEEEISDWNDVDAAKKYRTGVFLQAKHLIVRDAVYVIGGLFVICIVEGARIQTQSEFTIWKIIFECVTAYGTVGISLGWPGSPVSFSGQFETFAKLVICLLMLMGRHRGLPESIDRAVQLYDDEELEASELDDLKPRILIRNEPIEPDSGPMDLSIFDDDSKNEYTYKNQIFI